MTDAGFEDIRIYTRPADRDRAKGVGVEFRHDGKERRKGVLLPANATYDRAYTALLDWAMALKAAA